jgi:hypothetical protein
MEINYCTPGGAGSSQLRGLAACEHHPSALMSAMSATAVAVPASSRSPSASSALLADLLPTATRVAITELASRAD